MPDSLKKIIENTFLFYPNLNQLRNLERLYFEIMRKERIPIEEITTYLKNNVQISKYPGKGKFFALRDALIKKRFPLTFEKEKIDTKRIFLNKLRSPLKDNWQVYPVRKSSFSNGVNKDFKPLKIFVEKEVRKSFLVKNFQKKFPGIEIEEINYYSEYLKKNKFSISQLKKPLVFIIKEKWDFIKRCPCTKYHLCCGYWIFNLGFGCPFDCSYCFLQQYTNFPGILLPGNIKDFFKEFDQFHKKLKKPIRIGTGEFCDSLALDEITEYSKKLIPYFKDKNVLFELKTKSAKIANLCAVKPPPNVIISWSLSPSSIVETQEIGAASLKERLMAAKTVRKAGYKVGFHFDPIIHIENWQKLYREVIDKLYSFVKPPFSWISLGTLRSNRKLKTISEMRFPESNIFYGELFLGEDKKLRYPPFLRKEIYEKMVKWIREYDPKTPLYLCMENKDMWNIIGEGFTGTKKIENYLLQK